MNIKTIVTYHFTPIRMATIKKKKKKKLQVLMSMQRNWNPCALLVEMQNGTTTVENSIAVPQEKFFKLKQN